MPADVRFKNPEFEVGAASIDNDLKFLRMSGHEGLGRAFAFEVDLVVDNASINLLDALDQTMTITGKDANGFKRYFHGHVTNFAYIGAIDLEGLNNRHRYRATA